MKKKSIFIIDIPFNTDKHPFCDTFFSIFPGSNNPTQTKEWIDYRIGIFMRFTANSLINQTDKDFICIVRHSKQSEYLIKDALSKYPKLPDNIKFVSDGDSFILDKIKDYELFYHIRIDSDNMYHKDFIKWLKEVPYFDRLQCILCHDGYMYDDKTKRLAKLYHESPPFYATVYKSEAYINGYRQNSPYDHWGMDKLVNIPISQYSYMIIVHQNNISNNFDSIVSHPMFKANIMSGEEKDKILEEWNLK